jgi:hypothetical protein
MFLVLRQRRSTRNIEIEATALPKAKATPVETGINE